MFDDLPCDQPFLDLLVYLFMHWADLMCFVNIYTPNIFRSGYYRQHATHAVIFPEMFSKEFSH